MKKFLLSCVALAAASTAAVSAQSVTLRITGDVVFASAGGVWAPVVVGDTAVWEADLTVPGTDVASGQYTAYSMVPGSYTITVGSVSQSVATTTVNVQNDFPVADGLQVFTHPLPAGGVTELSMSDSSGTLFGSTDLTLETGTYAASLLDGGAWDMFVPGGSIGISYTMFEIVGGGCGTTASASFRNDAAGLNLPNFTANAPTQGAFWSASVTNPPGGPYVVTGVVAYPLAADVPLAFGSVLVNLAGGELLGLAPQLATTGTWSVAVPGDPALCGATFTAQGYGFGGGAILLYNAYDCVVGG